MISATKGPSKSLNYELFDLNEPQISSFKFLKNHLKTKTEFRPATDVNYSLLKIGELD